MEDIHCMLAHRYKAIASTNLVETRQATSSSTFHRPAASLAGQQQQQRYSDPLAGFPHVLGGLYGAADAMGRMHGCCQHMGANITTILHIERSMPFERSGNHRLLQAMIVGKPCLQ